MPLLIPFLLLAPAVQGEADLHRAVGLLDYVGADYALAVADGVVVNELEFDEQGVFLADAKRLVSRAQGTAEDKRVVLAGLGVLNQAVSDLEAPTRVASLSRGLREEIVVRWGLVLRPPADLGEDGREMGRTLFVENCSECHGLDGRGDTPRARELDPPPISFHDGTLAGALTPYKTFNAVSFGIPGTAMASLDALSASERWNIALYVLGLPHETRAPVEPPGDWPSGVLSASTDTELTMRLLAAAAPDPGGSLAWLRRVAPWADAPDEPLVDARIACEMAGRLASEGRIDEARNQLLSAYLDRFEPQEARLRVLDSGLVTEVEQGFLRARSALAAGAAFQEEIDALVRALTRADRLLVRSRSGPGVAFVGSLVILLREGAEAALLILALLAAARASGRPRAARSIHRGWMVAVAAGLVLWNVSAGLAAWGGRSREMMEGGLSLVAAAVLVWVGAWFLSRASAESWTRFLAGQAERAAGAGWTLALLAFLAVFREAAESVLFLRALMAGLPSTGPYVAGGAVTGLTLLAVLVWWLGRMGRRLPVRQFFAASGWVLLVLAVVFTGQGVLALQEAGVLPLHALSHPLSRLAGSGEALGAQLLLAAGLAAAFRLRHSRAA